jgi:hypothetical protein
MEQMLAERKLKQEQEQAKVQEQNRNGVPLGPRPREDSYADEGAKFDGAAPASLTSEVNSLTPSSIPGGTVLKTQDLYDAVKTGKLGAESLQLVLVDAWSDPQHTTIPTAKKLPAAGQGGDFEDNTQKELWAALNQLTGDNFSMPIVFFSKDARHWGGYNAALRAIEMGLSRVYWYRGGIASWKAAGQPLN